MAGASTQSDCESSCAEPHASDCGGPPRALRIRSITLEARLMHNRRQHPDMVGTGINLATTKDGEAYNKLQRPSQSYLASTAPPLPPTRSVSARYSPSTSIKRKQHSTDAPSAHKRTKVEGGNVQIKSSLAGGIRKDDAADCGMRVLLPSFDDDEQSSEESMSEALAYLRSVR